VTGYSFVDYNKTKGQGVLIVNDVNRFSLEIRGGNNDA